MNNGRGMVRDALNHRQPSAVPIDINGTLVTGMHASCVEALREWYGLPRRAVRMYDVFLGLGYMETDLLEAMRIDVQADILECEVYRSLSDEQACLGAAMAAGVGTGVYTDFSQAGKVLVRMSDTVFSPNQKNFSEYREGYRIYRDLYGNNAQSFKDVHMKQ